MKIVVMGRGFRSPELFFKLSRVGPTVEVIERELVLWRVPARVLIADIGREEFPEEPAGFLCSEEQARQVIRGRSYGGQLMPGHLLEAV